MTTSREEIPWRQITLFLLTLGVLVLCALVLQPFFTAIVGAIVLAVVTQRPYDWLATKIKHRSTCAAVALVLVILAVIVPIFLLAHDLGGQTLKAITALRSNASQNPITDFIANRPALASRLEAFTDSIDVNNAARTTGGFLAGKLSSLLGDSIRLITQLVVMLFLLFFLFRDRALAITSLHTLLPMREHETHELLERVGDTILATALGRLTIAAVQGLLAGLAFWALGVPGVILWAFTLMAFAMIPAFGAFLVWGPIAIYLGLNGHWGKAALLAIWGGLIVSTIDNILYPILIGGHLRAHTATILLSILGGIAVFGPIGIILGPVLFTIATALLDIWRARTIQIAIQP
ncbi:AI-2E family transporter [Tunturiibacter lichenicola]|uniref:AI-2E family transporter n=1 Tax=Tunturiibacter lichenicola TaxID=2051959 RepID=UPI0021B32591|nr:AI-2E family transporter [Edaphobacter lichenicola]